MIGTTLKNILDQKGITANELARQIDVSNQTLYSIIKRDNMKVDFDLLLKICDALDVDIEIFYKDYLSEKQKNNISIDKQPPLQNEEVLNSSTDYSLDDMKQRIKALKKERNITSEQLAELSGVSIGALNKLLGNETKDPSITTIIKIAKSFEVSADYLIYGDNQMTPDKSQADINAILRKKEQEDIEYLKLKKNTINYIRMAKLDMYQLYELQGVISALEKVYDMKHGSE